MEAPTEEKQAEFQIEEMTKDEVGPLELMNEYFDMLDTDE